MFTAGICRSVKLSPSRDSSLVTANGPLPRAVRSFWGQLIAPVAASTRTNAPRAMR